MNTQTTHVIAVKQAIENLIHTASHYDINALDHIYHANMQVVMIDPTGQVHKADKTAFKAMVSAAKDSGTPMNTWAEFHHIEADAKNGHVVLSRKNNLAGQDMHLDLSIDFVYEDERWQVVREVIFIKPDETL